MRDYLSIYLEHEGGVGGRAEHVERAVDVVSKYDARDRAPCRLACEIRNYRDDSEQLGSSTGWEWRCAMASRRRDRARGREVKKTELLRGANVCALAKITREAGLLLSRSLPLARPSASSASLSFSFSPPIRINVADAVSRAERLEVNSRVHLRSARRIIQRALTGPRKKRRSV